MAELKEYLILRYSLIEERQKAINPLPLPSIKGAAIICAVERDRELEHNRVLYSLVGFHSVQSEFGYDYPNDRFYIGKLAKLQKQQTGEKIPGDILEIEHDNWVPITIIIDIETQHIYARKDWRFGTPEQISKSVQLVLTDPVLSTYNYRIFVEGKSEPAIFWNVLQKKNKVYRLEFKLISPNILDTNRKARDALEELRKIFDQDEVDLELSNKNGDLKVPEQPVSNYLEYIGEGEGTWKVTTEGERGGKKTFSSMENINTINLPALASEIREDKQFKLDSSNAANEQSKSFDEANLVNEVYAASKSKRSDQENI
jgi:hypothetical protein